MAEQTQSHEHLFAEFSPSTRDEWVEATIKSLKGKPFEKVISKTVEGFDLQPMYRAEDIANIEHKDSLPGHFPYIRGTKPDGYRSERWHIAQNISISDPKVFNEALKHDLERGQTAIYIDNNFQFESIENMKVAFADIDLLQYPIFLQADRDAVGIYRFLKAYLQDEYMEDISGCIGYDPIHQLAQNGEVSGTTIEATADYIERFGHISPKLDMIAVRTNIYHDAGANAVQELAIAMATGVTYISEMLERGLDIDSITQKMRFFLSVGENFFMEIAKLRAIKMMWAQIVREFGGDAESQKIKLHASTGTRNKTQLDAHVNMLRVTTEAMAGAIGGVDSMTVAPFDTSFSEPDDFSRRIARNIQLILQEEVNLTDVIDPAGGSWYVEHLTNQLAQSAWEFFQQIEAQGGMISALQVGFIQEKIDAVAEARNKNIASRKNILVGTNMYSNLNESLSQDHNIPSDNIPDDGDYLIEITPLQPMRLSEPFEILRANAETYGQTNGDRPQIFLANFGTLPEYKARMDFTQGFYEVGGFELTNQGEYDTIASAVSATLASNAGAVVICSTDANYTDIVPDFAQAIKAQKPDMVVILAGYPKDQIDEYKQAGVDDFIHIRANCYEMNQQLQDRLGVGS
jgi:methylmalonyl-CoA mutase